MISRAQCSPVFAQPLFMPKVTSRISHAGGCQPDLKRHTLALLLDYFNAHTPEELLGQTLAINIALIPLLFETTGVPFEITIGWIELGGKPTWHAAQGRVSHSRDQSRKTKAVTPVGRLRRAGFSCFASRAACADSRRSLDSMKSCRIPRIACANSLN